MTMKFTEEQLNSFDKSMLIQLFLNQQEQLGKVSADLHSLDTKDAGNDGTADPG